MKRKITATPKNVTRGDVMQAMRQKCNQLIFQTKRPPYHKGEITENFFKCYVNKEIAVTKLQHVGYITDIAYLYM